MVHLVHAIAAAALLVAFFALLSAPAYLLLSLPGILALRLARRRPPEAFWPRAVALSTLAAALLSPAPVLFHFGAFLLPLPFALWLGARVGGNPHAAVAAMTSAAAVLMTLLLQSWRYSRREEAGVPPRRALEELWRGPTRG
jgi:hypothetical protein